MEPLALSWVTAVTFLLVSPHAEALDCYYCKWIDPKGRETQGTSLNDEYEERFSELLSDARKSLPEDATCKSSKPSSTAVCGTGCSWTVFTNPTGKVYLRGCAGKSAQRGKCRRDRDGVVMCYCEKSVCNGLSSPREGGQEYAPNSGFRLFKEDKILAAAGLLAFFRMGLVNR